jgi:hypothetical protein
VQIDEKTAFSYLTVVIHEETGKKIPQDVPMKLQDFKVGDYIEVLSAQNIKDKEIFIATEVRLLSHQK